MEVMEELSNFVVGGDNWNKQELEMQRRLRSKIAVRKRRQDPEIREREREKNLLAMRRRRENPETREKERERNRIAMRLRRQDPEFREKEKLAVKLRRMTNPDLREKDKIAHRIKRQNPEFREYERQRQRCLAMRRLAHQLEYAETADRASFYLTEVNKWSALGSQTMEEERIPQGTSEVDVIPFHHATIKQEEVESSDSVDMMASYQEGKKIKDEQPEEVEMDPSLAVTMMSVVLKDDSNTSTGDVEELVVEPAFNCFSDEEKCEEEIIPTSAMVLVPENVNHQNFLDEDGYFETTASESKRIKYTTKKPVRATTSGSGLRVSPVYRCPQCSLCLTSADYLARHVRHGCRFRDTPIKNAYRCTLCGEGFNNYGELYQHKRRTHGAPDTIGGSAGGAGVGAPSKQRPHPRAYDTLPDVQRLHSWAPPAFADHFPPYSVDAFPSGHPASPFFPFGPGLLPGGLEVIPAPRVAPSPPPPLPPPPPPPCHVSATPEAIVVTPDITSTLASGLTIALTPGAASAAPLTAGTRTSSPSSRVPAETSSAAVATVALPAPLVDVPREESSLRQIRATGSASRADDAVAAVANRDHESRTPDLVFSSSSAVNHFEPVVPDVAASSSSSHLVGPDAPDIVSCSRPGVVARRTQSVLRSGPGSSAVPATGEGPPPDLVAISPQQGCPIRESLELPRSVTSHLRLTSSAHKRKNSEAASPGRRLHESHPE